MANSPVLFKPIERQVVNVGASLVLDLKDHIETEEDPVIPVKFVAELANGDPLPKGLICTQNGTFSGIPDIETMGNYEVVIVANNDIGTPLTTTFNLTIKPRITMEAHDLFADLKSRVWEALGKDLPVPEIADILNRPVTAVEIYYLLQRFAMLTIWDVYNLEVPSDKVLIQLEGASEHYNVYDRGSCLVGAPKDLFSHKRTLEDALMTARAMAKEVFNRGWVIEFAGFNKMVRAAWVELQILSERFGKEVEILHYTPNVDDLRIYTNQSKARTRMGK